MVVEEQFIQTNYNMCEHYDHTCDMVDKLIESPLTMTSATEGGLLKQHSRKVIGDHALEDKQTFLKDSEPSKLKRL